MPCTYRLSSVILELAQRAGMDPERMDVGLLDREVRGFAVTNGYPVSGALLELSKVFFFDPSNQGGRLRFIPRGANAIATITEDDLVDDGGAVEESKRPDPISVPRVLHLNYHDVAGGLATDKQSSDRAGDRRATGEVSLASPVLMNADEAAQVAAINHRVAIEDQRGELRFSLPDSMLRFTPADVVFFQRANKTERIRFDSVQIFDGYLTIIAMRDRQSAYTSDVQGIPAGEQTAPPSSLVGPTLLEVLDIPALRDSHDRLGFYVAVSGVLPAWQGAAIEISFDGGENYVDGADWSTSAVIGELATVLDAHPQAYPDFHNVVQVSIDTPHAELEEVDLTGLLNRENLAIVGDELLQFGGADEVSPGVWELSDLVRGRRGTDPQAHAIGERFVLLERDALAFVDANLTDIGREMTFRATSFGDDVENGTVQQITFEGRNQIERAVGYLQARLDGTDLLISWQGVGRIGAGATVAHGVNFDGYRVRITDGSNDDEVETAAQSLVHDVTGWGSPITVTVAQLNTLTGPGPESEVTI